jgi:hypothetical protein
MDAPARSLRLLEWALAAATASLLVLHLAPNTADPDLWGHVLFGHRLLETGQVERTDPFSWTSPGAPWINHEVLAEVAMALAHRAAGGTGLLALKVLVGLFTFALAIRLGMDGSGPAMRLTALVVGAVAIVEIGFGFACRPQIFTALALPVLIAFLRMAHEKHALWLVPVPFLFCLWFNTHGGALAGIVLLATATVATSVVAAWGPRASRIVVATSGRLVPALWLTLALSCMASLLNPWGAALPAWLVQSVLWSRPEIQEWGATPIGWDHAVFFLMAAGLGAALTASRRPIRMWEIAIAAVLAVAAARHVRHTPLFAIAVLIVLPPHLLDALSRLRPHTAQLAVMAGRSISRVALAILLVAASIFTLWTAWFKGKGNPCTMEVPTAQYPVDTIQFMKSRGIAGNVLVYFDWGEMCIWELPGCRVSIDGRLDTCYPKSVIDAHWRIFRGDEDRIGSESLTVRADWALLPHSLPGVERLLRSGEWTPVFSDGVAVLLAKTRSPHLANGAPATAGPRFVPFPDRGPSTLLDYHQTPRRH